MDMDKPRKRKGKDRGRIYPEDGIDNSGYEMDSIEEEKQNNKTKTTNYKFQDVVKKGLTKNNAISVITNIKKEVVSKWRAYTTTRRGSGIDRKKTGGLGLEYDLANQDQLDGELSSTQRQRKVAINRNLIEYFARIGQSQDDVCVDLEHVEWLIKSGADINCTDKYGQTVLHEVARAWHTDVAKFLTEHKADPNAGDNYGRTPLHVAAAVDYAEMAEFLIANGANKESLTKGEKQTPTHFAARNDACNSLKALIKEGCEYKDVRDYKGRTPLHLAAELDRSETARMLLELDDPAPAGVTDNCGQSAIAWMIGKMPPVAKVALDQFHTTDRANRRQYYHLQHVEPRTPDDKRPGFPQTALRICVRNNRYDLIEHEVFLQLIRIKWKRFGRQGAIISVVINLLFSILWSIQGMLVEYDKRYIYILPEQWWRILLFVMAICLTIYQIEEEFREYFHSGRAHKRWRDWREAEIEKDKKFAHPRWPEEEAYLDQEDQDLDKLRPQYFSDFWNIYDWICYAFLLVVIITHLVDLFHHTHFTARLHVRIMAITIIFLWLRLMKNARAFALLGPFIVMVGHMLKDFLLFIFIYLVFYIPYACAFWMLFGEDKVPEEYQGLPEAGNYTVTVSGMGSLDALFFTLFRITLVDDYDYDGMKSIDSLMAGLLVGTWLTISAVLMLNMLIALLSDTFQRVYDNAKANALMQKAIFILNIEESKSQKKKDKFRAYIHTECSPKSDFYDDDAPNTGGGDELKKVAFQIKDDLEDLSHQLKGTDGYHHNNLHDDDDDGGGGGGEGGANKTSLSKQLKKLVTTKKLEQEIDLLRSDVTTLQEQQEHMMSRFKRDFGLIKGLLQELVTQQGLGGALVPSQGGGGTLVPRMMTSDPLHTTIQPLHTTIQPLHTTIQPQVAVLTRTGSLPPQQRTLMSSTHDADWLESEQRRRDELDVLRQQLREQAADHGDGGPGTSTA